VDGFINILGLIAMGVIFGIDWLQKSVHENPRFYLGAVIVTYSVWLGINIFDIVDEEFHRGDTPKSSIYSVSVLTFVLWIALLFSAPYALGFVAQKVAIHDSQASVPPSCVGHMSDTDPICVQDGNMYFTGAEGDIQRFPSVKTHGYPEIAPADDPRWFEVDTSAFGTSVYRCRYTDCPSKPK
jgi:hypothetical protein